MEIFTNEFKELLTNQLVELADVVKTKRSNEMSDYEIAKAMENCMDCYEEENKSKKDKNKKNKKFKVGDVVYWGESQGVVFYKDEKKTDTSLGVNFKDSNNYNCYFTENGRYYINAPIVLSHFPYKLKMKKIKK
jgi:hypothetical protein